jgi:hypothetical protein
VGVESVAGTDTLVEPLFAGFVDNGWLLLLMMVIAGGPLSSKGTLFACTMHYSSKVSEYETGVWKNVEKWDTSERVS